MKTCRVKCRNDVTLNPHSFNASVGQALNGPDAASFNAISKDPSILTKNQALVDKFRVAPWLLPPRTKLFDYSEVTSFDAMLELRSKTILNTTKCITLLLFDKSFAVMTQNASKTKKNVCTAIININTDKILPYYKNNLFTLIYICPSLPFSCSLYYAKIRGSG